MIYELFNLTHPLADVSSAYDYVDWPEYLKMMLGRTSLPDNVDVTVIYPDYMRDLKQILENTPKKTLANYMVWSVLPALLPFVPGSERSKRSAKSCGTFLQSTMP